MNKIQQEIDQELNQMKLPSDFADNIMQTQETVLKPFYKRFSAAAVLIVTTIILGTSAVAGYLHYQSILINKQKAPELDEMTVYPYALKGRKLNRTVQRRYDSYEALKKEIPFPLLDSAYSNDKDVIYAEYISNPYNSGLQNICIHGFILGDIKNLSISKDKTASTWESGKEFDYPVDLEIEILSDEKQAEKNLAETQFEGTFEFVEQYTSKQDYKVNIIGSKDNNKSYHAIFVADGIRYTLRGGVTLDKMKEIVDSMQY